MNPVAKGISEDWLSVWIGLLVFVLALGALGGTDMLGWVVTTSVWTDLSKALNPVSKAYSGLGGVGALIATYVALLVAMTAGAAALKADLKRFALGFTAVFWISYLSWIAGSYANFAVTTPADMQRFGISWSLKLTNEGGFILALVAGLVVGNFFPGFAAWMKEAVRPELYIKTAIVLLGGFLGIMAATQPVLAKSILFRGLAAGSAIRARPIVPIMVASLVVIFAVVELLILPFAANAFLAKEPMVAGAWMGLAVKTDGAAVASGAIAESLILATNAADGVNYAKGWILGTTATVKIFIDIFIGIWAFILAWIWTNHIEVRPAGDKAKVGEIWERFPKFIVGYVLTFLVVLLLAYGAAPEATGKIRAGMGEANTFRVIFFIMTFFTIGVMSNFRKLWEEGIGKLAAVYVVCLFGFVIWVGLVISWVFFAGVKPPLAGS